MRRPSTGYVEVTFTTASHGERLGDPDMPLDALLTGLRRGAAETGVAFGVSLGHSRRRPVARFRRTLDLALARPGEVVAIGLAGEESHSLVPFAPVVAEAAEAGIRLVHHAGETGWWRCATRAGSATTGSTAGCSGRSTTGPHLRTVLVRAARPDERRPGGAQGEGREMVESPPRLRDGGRDAGVLEPTMWGSTDRPTHASTGPWPGRSTVRASRTRDCCGTGETPRTEGGTVE